MLVWSMSPVRCEGPISGRELLPPLGNGVDVGSTEALPPSLPSGQRCISEGEAHSTSDEDARQYLDQQFRF